MTTIDQFDVRTMHAMLAALRRREEANRKELELKFHHATDWNVVSFSRGRLQGISIAITMIEDVLNGDEESFA